LFPKKKEARERREEAQIMYTHVSKCKNNKIKFKKEKGNEKEDYLQYCILYKRIVQSMYFIVFISHF
jgi:hypothetical protein